MVGLVMVGLVMVGLVMVGLVMAGLAAGAPAAAMNSGFDAIANATTCRAWTGMRGLPRDAARTRLQAWLTHTVTGGWNAPIAPGSDAGLDYAGIFGMTDEYCALYPARTMQDAGAMLIEEMDSR
jgi:hypothetical protein